MPISETKVIWTAREVAAIVNGRWLPEMVDDLPIAGVTYRLEDVASRTLFFVARPDVWGANFPATHQMLPRVADLGAMGAVIDEQQAAQNSGAANAVPLLVVGSTLDALQALALAARRRFAGRIAAVTGTVGKTSVCRMLTHVLQRQGNVVSTAGLPNSTARLRVAMSGAQPESRFGVFELNMAGADSVAPKSRLLQPDVAVVTALGPAHLEHHRNGMESVVQAKAGIVQGLRPGGTVILPRDTPWYEKIAAEAAKSATRVVSFGEHPQADVRLIRGDYRSGGSTIEVVTADRTRPVRLSAPGRHIALNCLAMLAAVEALQGDVDQAAADIADWLPPAGRGRASLLRLADGEALLIDHSCNANPESMQAAFELLKIMAPKQGGRRIAVLADMLELGGQAEQHHADLAPSLLQAGVDRVFTLGEKIQTLRKVLPADRLGPHLESVDQLVLAVQAALRPGDVVTVSGSQATNLGNAVESLRMAERASDLLIDVDNRRIVYQNAIDAPRIPASLTKLMTLHQIFAALDAGAIRLDEQVRASARATHLPRASSVLGLAEGDLLSVEDIIRSLIIQSANDAAICAAERLAGTEADFARGMTRTAEALGLQNTSFANASGEHTKGNQTTAREIGSLALAIIDRFPHYLHYFAETGFVFRGRRFPPRNRLIGKYPGLLGMKTGHVPASGYHLVGLAQRGKQRLLSVVMGAPSRDVRDERTTRLLDLGFAAGEGWSAVEGENRMQNPDV